MTDDVEGLLSEIATELSPERREEILSKGWDQMVTSLYAEVARSGEHGDYQRLAFESWIIDGKDELLERCAKSIAALQRERDEAREALKPFLGDETIEGILWGDLPDEATGTVTVQLRHFRAARAALGETQ